MNSKWIKIRKELYRQTMLQIEGRLGDLKGEILNYRKNYEKDLKKSWKAVPREYLIERMTTSPMTLLGDFHALQQSQKAHLRLLKRMPTKKRKFVLALECVHASDQAVLDRFQKGKITERDFLKKIEWQKNWGFPWEHYRGIFRWAIKNKVKIFGLNQLAHKKTQTSLKARDQFAAKKVFEILRENQDSQVIIIYGDLHLSKKSLPYYLEKIKNLPPYLRIFQNAENVYFQLLQTGRADQIDLVQLGKNDFCLLSVPPWVKWQNYLMYLESTEDREIDEYGEVIDFTDHVSRYIRIIADELEVNVNINEFSVYTAQESSFWDKLEAVFNKEELKFIELMIEDEKSFYIPEINVSYLARASVNHAASLAMQFVHAQVSGQKSSFLKMPLDFKRQIWAEGISYFGSKLINSKRKSDTLMDIKLSLAKGGDHGVGKEPLMLALSQKMQELLVLTGRQSTSSTYVPRRRWSYFIAAQMLGAMLGEKIYHGYREKILSNKSIAQFVSRNIENPQFDLLYYELLEIIESIPQPFRSKTEKL